MRKIVSVLLWCSVLSAADARLDWEHADAKAAGMDAQVLAKIPIRMKEFVDGGKTAGVVTVVARHGQIASFEAVGYQDLEKRTPMRKDTLFRIASLTKPITCAGIMILVDEGKLSLIDPVERYIPEYKSLKLNPCGTRAGYNCEAVAPSRPINVEDLMTHTSGLPSSADTEGKEPASLAELVSAGAKAHLLFEPGRAWNYSNIGIDILGRLIEVIAGQPFDTFLQQRIFGPLGMKDTAFLVPAEKQSRLASLYSYEEGKLKLVQADWGRKQARIPSPAGGLVSTAADLLRFNEMMRRGGDLDGQRILSSAAAHLMTISHTGDMKAGWAPGVGHGYGYEVVRDTEGMFRYNSIGTYVKGGAYRTYEWVDQQKDLTGVIMMQLTNGGGDVADEINRFTQISEAAVLER